MTSYPNYLHETIENLWRNPFAIHEVDPALKKDPYLWISFIRDLPIGLSGLREVPKQILKNQIFFLETKKTILSHSDFIFSNLPEVFKNDKDIVLDNINKKAKKDENYVMAFFEEEIPEKFKQDYDVILLMMSKITKNTPVLTSFLKEANNPLLRNPNFILDCLKVNERFINFFIHRIEASFKSDKKFMLDAIEINHKAIEYASAELKEDRDFLIKAIQKNPQLKYERYFPRDIKTDPEVENYGDKITIIKVPSLPLYLNFQAEINKEEIIQFKETILEVAKRIKASKLPNFSKALAGELYVGDKPFFKKNYMVNVSSGASASYDLLDRCIYFYTDHDQSLGDAIRDLSHEFGHRYHHTVVKNGMNNERVRDLYKEVRFSCKLPQIGDPLSDLREDWWNVKRGSESEYYLSKIEKVQGWKEDKFIYINDEGLEKTFSQQQINDLISCPSQYGSKSHEEWFAEMCNLINFNKVKPNQKTLVDRLIQILEEETI